MPSLRKRVTSYFRQLSFHNEPRERKHNINENTFVTKYLEGHITLKEGPPIVYGKNPTDIPNYELGPYETGSNTIIGCYSGPSGGLTTVKRIEKHLSVLDADIDFIDTYEEETVSTTLPKKSPNKLCPGQPIDNTTMIIKVAGHEYCVTNKPKRHNKSHSLGSISDFGIEVEKTKIDKNFYCNNNNCETVECKNSVASKDIQSLCDKDKNVLKNRSVKNPLAIKSLNESNDIGKKNSDKVTKVNEKNKEEKKLPTVPKPSVRISTSGKPNAKQTNRDSSSLSQTQRDNYGLSKSKSEGNPFHHKKKGKIIKITRPIVHDEYPVESIRPTELDDSILPSEWNKKSDYVFGISDSLYDRNQITKHKNGDPIADCFGIIARNDSAILAVADGVNWGEKASIAAKSAVHGSLHYLNKTIFNDTKPFENLTIKTDESSVSSSVVDKSINLVSNTRDVFVCLLRAFNCAHDLILENKGMLTTLTVAVILPLKQKLEKRYRGPNGEEKIGTETQYVCCICNVGDTLAYVYSQKYGVRELTKGSHDINCNRDMRDALGALGPVDGINPELSNLTISITTLQKGDIVMVASDGLTDNFDPNVSRFSVNTSESIKPKRPSTSKSSTKKVVGIQPLMPVDSRQPLPRTESTPKPPIKPPRRSKNRDDSSRSSAERSSIKSSTPSEKSTPSAESIQVPSPLQHSEVSSSNIPLEENKPNIVEDNTVKQNKEYTKQVSVNSSDNVPVDIANPLIVQFMRDNSLDDTQNCDKSIKNTIVVENKASSLRRQASSQHQQERAQSSHTHAKQSKSHRTMQIIDSKDSASKKSDVGYKFLRSKTTIDMRYSTSKPVLRNEDGIPYVTPIQRYELQLLLMEDILKNGISGKDSPCTSARKLCENLVSYTISITAAKRHTLEDQDLYYDNRNGVLVEVSGLEKKIRRKKGLEKVQNLPGKLDHVTIVAYNVGNCTH